MWHDQERPDTPFFKTMAEVVKAKDIEQVEQAKQKEKEPEENSQEKKNYLRGPHLDIKDHTALVLHSDRLKKINE